MKPLVIGFVPEEDAREAALSLSGHKVGSLFKVRLEAHAGDQFYRAQLVAFLQDTFNGEPYVTEIWAGSVVVKFDARKPAGERVSIFVDGQELNCLPDASLSRTIGPKGIVPVLEVGLRGRMKITQDCIVFTALTREEERAVKHNAFRTGGS